MGKIPCPECGKLFNRQSGLDWHLSRAHEEGSAAGQDGRASMQQDVDRLPLPEPAEPQVVPTEPVKKEVEVRRYYVIA